MSTSERERMVWREWECENGNVRVGCQLRTASSGNLVRACGNVRVGTDSQYALVCAQA